MCSATPPPRSPLSADPCISISHWQLRHYISAPEPNILYYASGHDIYCLNTASKKRKHIATLPFEARCTASGYGWVCVGGEDDGHFAAIKLDGAHRPDDAGRRAAGVKVERIGEEIVNSISIHRVRDEDAHLDDIVAVLTNNDKTVRLYSLPQGVETTVLDLPFPMNHATISPDGHTLVVVGDVNRAYFFRRHIRAAPPQIPKPHNRLTSASIEWTLASVVTLYASRPDSVPPTAGYFTTAWAPNGRLVAVGSEGGFITVFDVDILQNTAVEDIEAIVAVVPSSRADLPAPHPGAVRSMLFSPDPWDLLIWAEDQGRVCIGDLRTGLKRKQVVHLEPHEDGLRKVTYEDVPADEAMPTISPATRDIDELEAEFIRRYRSAPDNATAVNFATEYIEARRRQRQHRQDLAAIRTHHIQQTRDATSSPMSPSNEDDPQGLTAREQQILESLRTTRRREEARAHGGLAPRNVTYTSADMFGGRSPSSSSLSHPNHFNDGESATARPFSSLLANIPDSISLLDRASAVPPLESYSDAPHSTSSRLPRRRQSVVLSPSSGTNRPAYASTGTDMADTGAAEEDEEENPWLTIQEHMTLARGPLFESVARATSADAAGVVSAIAPAPQPASTSTTFTTFRHLSTTEDLQAELATERARARSLARQRDRWRSIRVVSDAGISATMREQQEDRDATAVEEAERRRLPEGYEALLLRRMQRRGGYTTLTATGAPPPPPALTSHGVRTAGLAMSEDGRRLWAACEEGIFEIEVNVKGRWFWPSVEVR